MALISDPDRTFIENKYHKTSEYFDPFDRFPYHGYEYDPETGLDDAEMAAALEDLFDATRDLPHPLAKAKGFAFVLDHMRIDASPRDYFVGFYNWARPLDRTFVKKWYREAFDRIPDVTEKMKDFMDSGTADMWLDMDHVVPNWKDILSLGFPGLLERVKRYRVGAEAGSEKDLFLAAIEETYEAIIRLVRRFSAYAKAHPSDKSDVLVPSLDRIAAGAPVTFFDALELMYIYYMCTESVDQYQARSLGNGLDRTLWRFYRDDLAAGRCTEDTARSYLAYFILQFSSIGNYWGTPFYLVGTDWDGVTDITPFSELILDVYGSLGLYNPKIQIKVDISTPRHFIDKVLNLIRAGHTSFVFCCVPGMIKSLTACYGVTEAEARECDISGCNEMHVRANEACMISSLPNTAKALEYVFTRGVDFVTGKQIGPVTADVSEMTSFEDFYAAFLTQFAYILDTATDMARRYEVFAAEISPALMLSGTLEHSLASGKDAYTFSMKYPTSAILLCSFATAVDSLLAVRELVFEKHLVTLSDYRDALAHNYEGYEDLRLLAKHAEHKYGNADPVADTLAGAVYRWFCLHVNGKPNGRGGVYKVGVPSTLHFISQGKLTAATPDGRLFGEECSKNLAPVIGAERRGVTGMIRSALSLSPWLFPEAHVLDVMLHPSAVAGDDGLVALRGILETYLKADGISIQFNIFSPEMLRDAQTHPEKYQNLEVRVSGWNVLWNNLSKEEQDAYILRAESLSA